MVTVNDKVKQYLDSLPPGAEVTLSYIMDGLSERIPEGKKGKKEVKRIRYEYARREITHYIKRCGYHTIKYLGSTREPVYRRRDVNGTG